MQTKIWDRPAPVAPEEIAPPLMAITEISPEEALAVAGDTAELLDKQGWCMWSCGQLGGVVIVVLADNCVDGWPSGYPVYRVRELHLIADLKMDTVRFIQEAKRYAGAWVESVNNRKEVCHDNGMPSLWL